MRGGSFLFPALIKTVVIPPITVAIALHYLPPDVPRIVTVLLHLVSLPLLFILRSCFSVISSTRKAKKLGAIDIPRVKGRWPLNLDVLRDWARSGEGEEVGRMMVLLGRRYGGTYNTRVLGEHQIISTDLRVLKHVLIDDFENFAKGPKFKDRAQDFLGDGIFNSDGESWKYHRALLRTYFHPMYISPPHFTPHISRFLSQLPSDGKAFDIQADLGRLALEMAMMWLAGEDISGETCSDTRGEEWERSKNLLGESMAEAQKIVGKRVKIGTLWPLFELSGNPLHRPVTNIKNFFRPLILEALDRKRQGVSSIDKEDVRFIDHLVVATDDLKLIEDQLINVLLASKDTLSSLLTFCVYAFALHPEAAKQIQGEVLSVAGPQGDITKDVIREMRYGRAFINEVLRLFPPVPLNIRRTLRPSLLPTPGTPQYMPANTSIILNVLSMQRSSDIWGGNASDFLPERWLDGTMGKEREGFLSWNAGPRMCLGQPFALTVTHSLLILLSRHLYNSTVHSKEPLSIKLAPDAQPEGTAIPESWKTSWGSDGRARDGRERVWVVADVVLAVKGGLWVRISPDDRRS